MNPQGQAFTAFRMLIAVIMALMVLLIIIAVINHFEKQKIEISKKRLFDGFANAFQSPNGDIIERSELAFEQGDIITAGAFAKDARMPVECISLSAAQSSAITVQGSNAVLFNQKLVTSVFFKCIKEFDSECEISCQVSVAQPFR